MGRVALEFQVANYTDVDEARSGRLPPDKVRRKTIRGIVDSGATRFVLPRSVVEELGLPVVGKVRVVYADLRSATRSTAQGAHVEILGRQGTFTAVVEPKRDTALVGAIVLEDLDLLLDLAKQRLIPRDPRGAVYEIE